MLTTLLPPSAARRRQSSIRGFVNIVSTARRFVQDVRVSLTGTQVVAFPSGATDECEVFRRELSLADLTGAGLVTLERGVNWCVPLLPPRRA